MQSQRPGILLRQEYGVVVRLGVHRVVLAVNVRVEVRGFGEKAVPRVGAIPVPEGQQDPTGLRSGQDQ